MGSSDPGGQLIPQEPIALNTGIYPLVTRPIGTG
jgi:hypothetical protein